MREPGTYEIWGGPFDGQVIPGGSWVHEELTFVVMLPDGRVGTERGYYQLQGRRYVWREEKRP